MKYINNFNESNVVNNSNGTTLRLVRVKYEGSNHIALAIGFGSGPYYMEKYYLLDGSLSYENGDFSNVKEMDPKELLRQAQ